MHERLLDALAKHGALADPAAMDYLSRRENPVAVLEGVIANLGSVPLILTMEHIQQAQSIARKAAEAARPSPPKLRDVGRAKDVADDIVILRDITGHSNCEGKLEDFARYFAHRLDTLRNMLRTHRELAGALDIARAKRMTRDVRFIGIVSDTRVSKKGGRIVELEDETDSVPVYIPQDSELFKDPVLPDEVLGVVGRSTQKGLVIPQLLVRPDVPAVRPFPASSEAVSVAFVSDVHVGSSAFLRERWNAFTTWMNDGDEVAKSIKYAVLAGDVVDGIGIYPRQDEELAIDDIYAQYEELARLLAAMPDHVTVLLLPGNHDAVRPAEPQPALPANLQKLFDSNVKSVGNPCTFTLHGVRILAYHGRSIDDFIYSIPGMTYAKPLDAMREMLRRRHLAPLYGGRTPIAPEAEDLLVIDEVPDVFVTGHVHAVGTDEYKGVKIVNASAWQSQTSYQKMHNLEPVPCRVPILNLKTGRSTIKAF